MGFGVRTGKLPDSGDRRTVEPGRLDGALVSLRTTPRVISPMRLHIKGPFGNSGSKPGRMLLITAPPGHEKYFNELRDLIAQGGKPDPDALAKLRAKYDTVQLATLTPG
jgi:hypothetical protein